MANLAQKDMAAISQARKQYGNLPVLFSDLDHNKMPDIVQPTGAIICSDGMQRGDVNEYFSKLWRKHQAEENIHEIKFAGAPYFAAKSTFINNRYHQDELILDEISTGIKLGRIVSRLILLGHYPCGKATEMNLNIRECVQLLICGRTRILQFFKDLEVSCAMQIDFRSIDPEKDRRTYHIDSSQWDRYNRKLQQKFPPNKKLIAGCTAK